MQAVVTAGEASLSGQMQPSVDFVGQHGVAVTSISKQLADADTSMSPLKVATTTDQQPNSPLMRKIGGGAEIHHDSK